MRLVAGLVLSAFLVTLPTQAQVTPFQHVIMIIQENRSPDNLFNDPNLIAAGADIQTFGVNSSGQKITLQPVALANNYDLGHNHANFLEMYDNGKMDGADKVDCVAVGGACPPNPQFRYVDNSDGTIEPYFQLAEQYSFANRMFQTNQGSSFTAHQFLFSGTSAISEFSEWMAAESPNGNGKGFGIGCTAAAAEFVNLINPLGLEIETAFPCFEHPTLTDMLDDAGVSWKYYSPSANSMFTAPNAIRHICAPSNSDCTGKDWLNDVVLNQAQVLTDIANCNLSQVNWVIPTLQASDHPEDNQGLGPSWVASIVNAVGTSTCNPSYWSNTAILITWDDWGGWYDHVPPFRLGQRNRWGAGLVYGFRVPLVVVSAYTPQGYISNVTHDFGSFLRFVEYVFSGPNGPLGPIPPGFYADAYADNLFDFFNFKQAPRPFKVIPATHDARYFINDTSPRLDPDTD